MHLDSLPDGTRALLEDLAGEHEEIAHFLLVGGTALTLNIAHRISEDLDFAWPERKLNRPVVSLILRRLKERGHLTVYDNPPEAIEDAVEHGNDLDDYFQNWLVDDVKLTFFAFGDYEVDRALIRSAFSKATRLGHVNVADTQTIFDAKCIALTDRIKSRDIFDLWWLIHKVSQPNNIEEIFRKAQHYRPHLSYEHIRHRLLDWKIPATDESFSALVQERITIDEVRAELREDVAKLEAETARQLLPKIPFRDPEP